MTMVRKWVIWGLVIFASFETAELTWAVYQPGGEALPSLAAGTVPLANQGDSLDLSRLQRATLFGAPASKTEKAEAKKAPIVPQVKSRLPVKLLGVIKGEGAGSSVAILAERNQQRAYGVGDRLVTENSATLIEIQADRVVLEVGGQHQYIQLQENGFRSAGAPEGIQPQGSGASGALPQRVSFNESSIRQVVGDLREKIVSDPLSFGRFVQLRPHAEDGRLTGYQLHPGRDARLFRKLGLRAGDRVTHVEGLDVTDPKNIPRLMELVQSEPSLRVGITRGQDSQDIDVEL